MSDIISKPTDTDLETVKSRAKFAELVKLPSGIKGTLCGSCEYFAEDKSFCSHKQIKQAVSKSCQCCSAYDRKDLELVIGEEIAIS